MDCEGLGEGRYDLKVKMDLDGSFTMLKSEKVSVRIARGNDSITSNDGREPEPQGSAPANTEGPQAESGEEE